tara:strand:+ start:185 stop:331 length:147 start_codon:yes stop_codon:yes gene_type:complete
MASEGAFSFSDGYNMPVFLKRFYIKKVKEVKDNEQAAIKKQQSKYKKT